MVKQYIQSWMVCAHSKANQHKPYGFLKQLPIPPHPWESISMDFIEQLLTLEGHTMILVIVDHCRRDISSVSSPPLGTSSGPHNISWSLQARSATAGTLFLLGFTEILLSTSAPNLNALTPLNRANSYDPNGITFSSIPIQEGKIQNLPVPCLHTFAG